MFQESISEKSTSEVRRVEAHDPSERVDGFRPQRIDLFHFAIAVDSCHRRVLAPVHRWAYGRTLF